MSMGSNPGDRGSYGPTIEIYVPPIPLPTPPIAWSQTGR